MMIEVDKASVPLRQAVLQAAAAAGEAITQSDTQAEEMREEGLVAYLKAQALATPGSFLTLLGKLGVQEDAVDHRPIVRIELVAPEMKIDEDDKSGS